MLLPTPPLNDATATIIVGVPASPPSCVPEKSGVRTGYRQSDVAHNSKAAAPVGETRAAAVEVRGRCGRHRRAGQEDRRHHQTCRRPAPDPGQQAGGWPGRRQQGPGLGRRCRRGAGGMVLIGPAYPPRGDRLRGRAISGEGPGRAAGRLPPSLWRLRCRSRPWENHDASTQVDHRQPPLRHLGFRHRSRGPEGKRPPGHRPVHADDHRAPGRRLRGCFRRGRRRARRAKAAAHGRRR